jgi:hypothetical protein
MRRTPAQCNVLTLDIELRRGMVIGISLVIREWRLVIEDW